MICKQCGTSLRPGSTSCAKCGAKQEASLESGGFANLAAQAREGSGGFTVPGDPGKPPASRPAPSTPPRPSNPRPAPVREAPPARNTSFMSLVLLVGLVVCLILSVVSCSRVGKLADSVTDLQDQITRLRDQMAARPEDSNTPDIPDDTFPVPEDTKPQSTQTQPDGTVPGQKHAVSQRDLIFTMDLDTGEFFCNDPEFTGERMVADGDESAFIYSYSGLTAQDVNNQVFVEVNLDRDDVEIEYDLDSQLFGTRNNSFIACRWFDVSTGQEIASNLELNRPEVILEYRSLTTQPPYLRCEITRRSDDGGMVTLIIDNIPAPTAR